MRASTNISLKERQTLRFSDFRGVDFSSSPLDVQSNRATSATNFINEYGVNRKRPGWNELFHIERDGEAQRINGIFSYRADDRREMLIHAGRRFYRARLVEGAYILEDITASSTYERAAVDAERLLDRRSQCFMGKKRTYIIGCGDYLVYGSWDGGETYELRRVANNEDTYIPTTTVSIDCDAVDDDVRGSLDDINYLSDYRINQLLGCTAKPSIWTLDAGSIDRDSDVSIRLETMADGEAVEYEIANTGEDKTLLYRGEEQVGTVDFALGKIRLDIDTAPQIENRDNIYVTFRHSVEGYADKITGCTFGTLFGVNGNTDRLFLSGNEAYPNIDFHSEMDDYTYFGDLNTSAMGSDAAPIGGYARLSDSTLVIYKENADEEASIFYRTGRYDEETDSVSGVTTSRAVFPTSAGSIGESIVSRYACVNFAGDSIMLSRNGVFGVVLSSNVAVAERYTRERSRSINEKLLAHEDLSEAVGVVFRGRYYLSLDGVCYVADSRYKYVREDDVDGSYNYEWWCWDNIPARVWAVIDGQLTFGSADGSVCVFDEQYTDRTHRQNESGDLGLDTANNRFIYREGLGTVLAENDSVTLLTDGIYALFADNVAVEAGRIVMSEEDIVNLYEGIEVYADEVGDSGLLVGKPYTIADVDKGFCTCALADEEGSIVALAGGGFRLHKRLTGRELYLTDVAQSSFILKETKLGAAVTLSRYNDSVPSFPIARFTHRENVMASWYTPVLDLGTNAYAKTLLGMTVATEPGVSGQLSFGYETHAVSRQMDVRGRGEFSFEDFSFEDFTFDTAFAASYTVRCNERNFNFIMFRFVSDSDGDCAVNNFTITYKINKNNKGVR